MHLLFANARRNDAGIVGITRRLRALLEHATLFVFFESTGACYIIFSFESVADVLLGIGISVMPPLPSSANLGDSGLGLVLENPSKSRILRFAGVTFSIITFLKMNIF